MTATRPLTEAEINACLLYRDALILVLNKPAGIAVHVTGHDKIALDQSFHHLQFGLPKKPELAHRLDRGTSGCLVLGRHRQALIKLGKLFENQRVNKTYRAICVGVPAQESGTITKAILKSGAGSKWKMSLDDAGQEAVTEYRVLNTNGTISEIEFSPKTGRTHQIRLHAAFALGCPVVGDPFYGPTEGEFSANAVPMMLHAETVEIPLQATKSPIKVTAPLPDVMRAMLGHVKSA
jgi:tRNA pseudouridine32 synthase / 23S rRNA pseudouridine746 synthase